MTEKKETAKKAPAKKAAAEKPKAAPKTEKPAASKEPKAEAKAAAPKKPAPAAPKAVKSKAPKAKKAGNGKGRKPAAKLAAGMPGTIHIVQTGSVIGRQAYQEATLKGLGLNKRHRTRVLKDTPEVRGMIEKVKHLVKVVKA